MTKYYLPLKFLSQFIGITLISFSPFFLNPVLGAENLIVKVGPLQRSFSINDLGIFAETGDIPPSLTPYTSLLTPKVQNLLNAKLKIDPSIGDKFLEELNKSTAGKAILERIVTAIPGSSVEILQAAIALLVRQGNELSLINLLKAYPEQNITINVTAIVGIALQINGSHLQSQIINPILDSTLKTEINPANLPPLNPALPEQMRIFQRTLNFRDQTRNRLIPVETYHAQNTRNPLIIMSHGFGSDRQFLHYLAVHLASSGFTVASVEHPGSNINVFQEPNSGFDLSQLLPPQEFFDRPRDISFILDQLTTVNQNHEFLKDKLNTENVIIIGHSFGGYTALTMAGAELNIEKLKEYCDKLGFFGRSAGDWLQCAAKDLPRNNRNFRDQRIKGAIALNPLVGRIFGDQGLEKVSIPTVILASGDDAITPTVTNQLKPFDQLTEEKYLIVALGATHLSVTDHRYSLDALRQGNITQEVIGDETRQLQEAIKGISLAFISNFEEGENKYKPFLSADYVQNLSNDRIQLRFTTEIPASLKKWLNSVSQEG